MAQKKATTYLERVAAQRKDGNQLENDQLLAEGNQIQLASDILGLKKATGKLQRDLDLALTQDELSTSVILDLQDKIARNNKDLKAIGALSLSLFPVE